MNQRHHGSLTSTTFLGALVVAVIAGLVSSSIHGAVFSNFEPPTYTASAIIDGVDGWTGNGNGVVTPYAFGDTYGSGVLQGSQSLWMLADNEKRSWIDSGLTGLVNEEGTTVIWLLDRPKGFGHSMMYLSDNFGIGATPAGLGMGANGNFEVYASDGLDTGVSYQTNKVYQLGMSFDFTNNTFTTFARDLTDNGALLGLGTYHMFHNGAWDMNAVRNHGGLWLFDYLSSPLTASVWDDIEVTPEPSTVMLLALGGLLVYRRVRSR